ncbi:MAG TPA: hypothetical protein VMP11_16055 [Verrucomicrobiae bacterium]|nr:hypothetical protein [Verrucomicrobiae bacterium]
MSETPLDDHSQHVDLARDAGYRDGSGITQRIKRLEAEAAHDPSLARTRENLSSAKS